MKTLWQRWGSDFFVECNKSIIPGRSLRNSNVLRINNPLKPKSDLERKDVIRLMIISLLLAGTFTVQAQQDSKILLPFLIGGSDNITPPADNQPPQIVSGEIAFARSVIGKSVTGAHSVVAADFEGDGDLDVVSHDYWNGIVHWFQNEGNGGFVDKILDPDSEQFTKQVIDTTSSGAYYVSPADIDGDGDSDFFSASQWNNHFAWFQNDGTGNFTLQLMDNNANGGRSIIATDLDRDGDIDAVAASADSDTCAWFENDGKGGFTKHVIDPPADDAAYGLFAIDFDQDGDIDVLTANRDGWTVDLHTQFQAHVAEVEKGGVLVIDSNLLNTIDSEDGPENLTYTIVDPPQFGEIRADGVNVPGGGTFTQEDINNGRLTYVHDGVGVSTDVFSFTVADSEDGDFKPAAGTFSISIITP